MNIYIKWILLVAINLPFSIAFASNFLGTIPAVVGVITGVILFVLMYIWLDIFLLKTHKIKWRKSLIIGVGSCAILLLYPGFPLVFGALALEASGYLLGIGGSGYLHTGFIAILLTTMIDGLYLSVVVGVFSVFARLIFMLSYFSENKQSDNPIVY